MKNFALDGDRTTTGGIVIATQANMFNRSRRVALSGEHATCGTCEGSFPMYGTAENACNKGMPAVLHGDQVSCPCGINYVMAFNEGMSYSHRPGGAGTSASVIASANQMASMAFRYDHQFQFFTEEGEPAKNIKYKIISASGVVTIGTTNAQGETCRVTTDAVEELHVYRVT